jgi:hypothetical protein
MGQMFAPALFPLVLAAGYLAAVVDPDATSGWNATLLLIAGMEIPLLVVRALVVYFGDRIDLDTATRMRRFLLVVFVIFVAIPCWFIPFRTDLLAVPFETYRPWLVGISVMIGNNALSLLLLGRQDEMQRARSDAAIADYLDLQGALFGLLTYALGASVVGLPVAIKLGWPDADFLDEHNLAVFRRFGCALAAAYFLTQALISIWPYTARFERDRRPLFDGTWVRKRSTIGAVWMDFADRRAKRLRNLPLR